ncbi:glycoside hydrolase family 47 protein [Armillaria novae-zelandiae]|uniref:alpha-1,2-Mannosidase n=1 Tax=Armillaria novae-zelandiae TaxID=153914 RepID=A0AA39UH17_9AGAR|nr:glycoside hydrolase family 47 protein [Armillaria novae-zelandiae]
MRWTVALSFFSFFSSLKVQASSVQKDGLTLPDSVTNYRDAVKDIFQTSYTAYKTYAWGHDDLTPESKSFYDGRNGWGASIVDAMSTYDEAVTYVGTIDFNSSKTSDHVSVFETTIRYLGGLLSVYELRGGKDEVLLEKAMEVADKMVHAWVGDNDIPFGHIDFSSNQPDIATSNIAEAGTLIIEWAALSKYTGNDTYRELADKAMRHIAKLGAPLPGLAAQGIDPASGEFVGGYVTWGGGSDSYFEYLLKYPRLADLNDTLYVDTWLTAVDSSIKYLLRRSTVGQYLYTCDYDAASSEYENVGSHLACFHAGNWLYGGTLLGNDTIVNTSLELLEGCWNTYASTATGIGPEAFAYITPGGNTSSLSADQQSFYDKHGFYITSSYYILRPEVLESNFYAWRITGDTKYLDRAGLVQVDSFKNYLTACHSTNSSKVDDMESFWFAEVLKYLYLTFDDPSKISLDDYVFNTEAHPFKAPATQPTYDSGSLTINTTSVFKTVSGTLPVVSPNVHISGVEV